MKKISFKITGTAYISDSYTQNDMVDFNKARHAPEDIKKAISESIFDRKRSFHLTITGENDVDWNQKCFDIMKEVEIKWSPRVKVAVSQFIKSFGNIVNHYKFYLINELLQTNCSENAIFSAIEKTLNKKIANVKYVKSIIYSTMKKESNEQQISDGSLDRSKSIIEKLSKYK